MSTVTKVRVRWVELELEEVEDTQVRRRDGGFVAALTDPTSKLRQAMASLPRPAIVKGGAR